MERGMSCNLSLETQLVLAMTGGSWRGVSTVENTGNTTHVFTWQIGLQGPWIIGDHWACVLSQLGFVAYTREPECLAYDQLSREVNWPLSLILGDLWSCPQRSGGMLSGRERNASFPSKGHFLLSDFGKIAFVQSGISHYLKHCWRHECLIFLPVKLAWVSADLYVIDTWSYIWTCCLSTF